MYNYLTSISLINFILLSLFSKVLKWCLPSNSNISQTLFFILGAVIFSFAMFGVNYPTSILSSDTFSFPSIYLQINVKFTTGGKIIPSRGPYPSLVFNL